MLFIKVLLIKKHVYIYTHIYIYTYIYIYIYIYILYIYIYGMDEIIAKKIMLEGQQMNSPGEDVLQIPV